MTNKVLIIDSIAGSYLSQPDIERNVLSGIADVEVCFVSEEAGLNGKLGDADVIISWHTIPLRQLAISQLTKCKLIVRAAVGFDSIDIQLAAAKNIPVSIVPDYGTEEVADHAMAFLLALNRNLFHTSAQAKLGAWDWRSIGPTQRLRGSNLGIVGYGRIGQAMAVRAKAFGMNVCFYDPFVPRGVEKVLHVTRAESLSELLDTCNSISVHVPYCSDTHHLIGANELRFLERPSSILVNTSRGQVIDQEALMAKLQKNEIKGLLGLDVLEEEPSVPVILAGSDRVLLSAHSAFYSDQSLLELRTKAATIVKNALLGHSLINVVNKPPYTNLKNINYYYDESGKRQHWQG